MAETRFFEKGLSTVVKKDAQRISWSTCEQAVYLSVALNSSTYPHDTDCSYTIIAPASGRTMSTVSIHWSSRRGADNECVSPSWGIQAHPPLEVVFRGEAQDDVSKTFDIIRGSLSLLRSSLVLSDSDKRLYSEEDLQDPKLATGFAEIQALKLATDVHPNVPTSVVRDIAWRDTALDESRFEPLKTAGIIITPEVRRSRIGYRLRSRSKAAWWRTPLTELETRKATEELVAAQGLHPLLSWRLETWDGYEAALSILNSAGFNAEKADIYTELEKFVSEAIEAFQMRSLESRASALQLEYERPDPSSRFAFSPPGQAPLNPLSRARAWTDPAVHQNNFPTGHVFSSECAVVEHHGSNDLGHTVVLALLM